MHAITSIFAELVKIPSPTGYTHKIIKHLEERFHKSGIRTRQTHKGALLAGNVDDPSLVISAHVDTLGAMVSSLSGGTIRVTQLGGWPVPSFEGEYLTLVTSEGLEYRGSFLLDNPAAHVNPEVATTKRTLKNTHVRLDVEARSEDELKQLGIAVGDVIYFDPRFERTNTGFVRSRFLDDKAGCACLIHVAELFGAAICDMPVAFYFSNFEEVGHGASGGFPASTQDLLAVDMGVVGNGVAGDELHCSICAKDSSGPYDYEFRRELTQLAEQKDIAHRVDVFPYYGSDGSAALKAGWEIRVGLIGPGVGASHGVERTHEKALVATSRLVEELIRKRFS